MNLLLEGAWLLLGVIPGLLGALGPSAESAGGEDGASLDIVRSEYRAGRDLEAVLAADQALVSALGSETSSVIVGEFHFWRGASLRRLGRLEEAKVALGTARRMGFSLPELHLELALTMRALKQDQEAEDAYREAERRLPTDDERRFHFAERWKQVSKEEPAFQLSVAPQVGFDSNIVGLAEDAPVAAGDIEEASAFAGLVVSAKYLLHRSDRQILSLDYRNQLRAYSEESDYNYTDNVFSVTGRQPLLEGADLEVRAFLGEAFTEGDGHLRTSRTVAPAILVTISSRVQARIWGDWTNVDYYTSDIPSEQDRDGIVWRGGLVLGWDAGGGWSPALHASYASYDTDGPDYDHNEWAVGFVLTTPEFAGVVVTPSITYMEASYDNLNSVVGFSEIRDDETLSVTITIALRGLEREIGYAPAVAIVFMDQASTIEAFDYSRWEPRVEVGVLAYSF
jgi:tetratricopeptide (TPR) repeat protein